MQTKRLFLLLLFCVAGLATGCGGANPIDFQNISNLVRVVFALEPQTTPLGTTMPAIRLEGRDQFDQVINISQGNAELRLGNNPTGASLLENGIAVAVATQPAQNGAATFSNLRVDKVGVGYTLAARYQVPGTEVVLTATSQSFDVTSTVVTSAIYLRSDQGLWDPEGQTANAAALDAAFGAGNWTQALFETANPSDVFQGNRLVFMEGSDLGANVLGAFLTGNQAAMRSFVSGGGRVIVNAAPNIGGNITTPFNATIAYGNESQHRREVVVEATHPIGVACNGTLNFSGSSFSHALVVADDMTPIITGPLTGIGMGRVLQESDGVVLAEGRLGAGLFLVGGMTTTNFHRPSPNALQLRANILRYAGGQWSALDEGPFGPETWTAGT
ncbi:hypothetical protein IV102_13565, partial [bacterium]|nr:hypothetical protein [bacterium]